MFKTGKNLKTTSNSKGSILVVDDETTIYDLLRTHFCQEGYSVDLCESYETLLTTDTAKYTLAIISLDLGEITFALRLVEQVTQQNPTVRTAVITCSANMSPALVIDSLNSGADDYLLKPFSLRELMARVRAVLRRYQ